MNLVRILVDVKNKFVIIIRHLLAEGKKKVSLFCRWTLRHLLAFCIFTAILSWLFTYFILSISQGNNYSDLLISISASLATIFALVFTGTTVLVQVVKRGYKTIDIIIRNNNIRFVYFFFFVAIIYPLFVLIPNENILIGIGINNDTVAKLTIATSISFLIFGVLVLIPYSFELFKIVKFNAIPQLKKDAKNAIKEIENNKYPDDLNDIIIELSDLGVIIIEYNDEYHMSYIIEELRDIGLRTVVKDWVAETLSTLTGLNKIGIKIVENISNEKYQSKEILYATESLKALTKIGLTSVDKRLMNMGTADLPVAFDALNDIRSIGVKAADKKLSKISLQGLEGILEIGIKAIEKNLEMSGGPHGFYNVTRGFLIEIGIEADKKDKFEEITKKSMQSLWVLSAIIQKCQREPEEWADKLNRKLNEFKLHDETANILFQSEVDNAKRIRPDLADEINSFEKIYKALLQ